VLERLFTLAFSGLVYPQIWEDPEVDRAALRLRPEDHVVTIASGGCNVLSYLIDGPARITAVDLNRAHVALTRLKVAALQHLPDHAAFHMMFARADDDGNVVLYRDHLAPMLDPETRRFWDGRTVTGLRRIAMFKRNLYRHGLLGRFIAMGHLAARAYGVDLEGILKARSIGEQRAFFEASIAPLFDRRLVRWATGSPVTLYGLGIPPAQYEALAGDRPMADVLRDRLARLACDFDVRDNYFAWQAFGRRYDARDDAALPPYLDAAEFDQLRERARRIEVRNCGFTDHLARAPAASADCYVLLDAQDWMKDHQLNDLWREITRTARAGARVIFRTAGAETILPGRVAPETLDRWRYEATASRTLSARDRASIYGGFHLYTFVS